MPKYDREYVDVGALQVGDHFELPNRRDTVCRVDHHSLVDKDYVRWHIIGYSIIEGNLHWPVIYLPVDYQVVQLIPTTTYVEMSGKDWVNSLTEHHGVTDNDN